MFRHTRKDRGRIHPNTLKRAYLIREITERHYEPGNQSRSLRSVHKRHVSPVYPMCYHTYLNYLRISGFFKYDGKEHSCKHYDDLIPFTYD